MLLPDSKHRRRDLTGSEHSLISKSSVSMITKRGTILSFKSPYCFSPFKTTQTNESTHTTADQYALPNSGTFLSGTASFTSSGKCSC
ncbi:hypothetical protein DPMN_078966 [Dreissena polymorpha]|uniref:Uncharacterized protein n=1 Tax=Dreissena polymorpha TaxID=45954 RepID=A0A9D3YS86_DREPO|nr:hypothetical protein DPMN_078966 [Dreissena polymorpha]